MNKYAKFLIIKRIIIEFIKKEIILFIFFFLLIILSFFYSSEIKNYPFFIAWKTISSFSGLLMITIGIKESGYFNIVSKKLLYIIESERSLSFFMIFISIFLSIFLTNDISLFIVVPLTISMKDLIKEDIDINKLVTFEAIFVNVGSALTPISNPQNLFL